MWASQGATSIESESNVSRPPEETQHPSVLAHVNDPAKSRIRDRDPLTLSPPRGNHPRSSACAPKDNREGRPTANHKNKEKGTLRKQSPDVCCLTASQRKKRALMTQSLVVSVSNHVEKKRAETRCAGRGAPKNLRRRSEIRAGSLALTARVRSGRDHPEREHVDHRNGSKHPVLFISTPSPRRPLPCLG